MQEANQGPEGAFPNIKIIKKYYTQKKVVGISIHFFCCNTAIKINHFKQSIFPDFEINQ
jgi:hypothetical protein